MKSLLIIALLLTGCGATQQDTPAPTTPQYQSAYQMRLAQINNGPSFCNTAIIGDSIAYGCSVTHECNFAIGGSTIKDVIALYMDALRFKHIGEYRLHVGVNDLYKRPITEIRADLIRLLMLLYPAPVTLDSVLPIAPQTHYKGRTLDGIHTLNREYAEIAAAFDNVTYNDMTAAYAGPLGWIRPELTRDGIHLTDEGCEIWQSIE